MSMKKKKIVSLVVIGVICLLLMLASTWYSVVFNESRLVVPMDISEYVFRVQDLPMICSIALFCLYILYLAVLLVKAVIKNKVNAVTATVTRKLNPKLGYLGFLGLFGFHGIWTYHFDKTIFPFTFFMFFGFFGFFYEGKMSGTLMDERYKENKIRANAEAHKISLSIIFLSLIVLGQGRLMGSLEVTLIAFVIIVTLAIALEAFLSQYLLYRYDHSEESEE